MYIFCGNPKIHLFKILAMISITTYFLFLASLHSMSWAGSKAIEHNKQISHFESLTSRACITHCNESHCCKTFMLNIQRIVVLVLSILNLEARGR